MSFARKIKSWGLATDATFATTEQESSCESKQIDILPMGKHQDIYSPNDAPKEQKEFENPLAVATVATVAWGSTFNNEVVEVHNQKLRRQLEASGLPPDAALALAINLQGRGADFDDRRICHECLHYTRKLCANAKKAELSLRLYLMPVPTGMAELLQRCPGFETIDFN